MSVMLTVSRHRMSGHPLVFSAPLACLWNTVCTHASYAVIQGVKLNLVDQAESM